MLCGPWSSSDVFSLINIMACKHVQRAKGQGSSLIGRYAFLWKNLRMCTRMQQNIPSKMFQFISCLIGQTYQNNGGNNIKDKFRIYHSKHTYNTPITKTLSELQCYGMTFVVQKDFCKWEFRFKNKDVKKGTTIQQKYDDSEMEITIWNLIKIFYYLGVCFYHHTTPLKYKRCTLK